MISQIARSSASHSEICIIVHQSAVSRENLHHWVRYVLRLLASPRSAHQVPQTRVRQDRSSWKVSLYNANLLV